MSGEKLKVDYSEEDPYQGLGFDPFDKEKAEEQIEQAKKEVEEEERRKNDLGELFREAENRLGRPLTPDEKKDLEDKYDKFLEKVNKDNYTPEDEDNVTGDNEILQEVNLGEEEKEAELKNFESELISEIELQNIIGVLEDSGLNVDRVSMMSHGSESMEESAERLKVAFQKMIKQSNEMLNVVLSNQNIGEREASEAAYRNETSRDYENSIHVIRLLNQRAQAMPNKQLGGALMNELQQIENNLVMINETINRRRQNENS